MTLFTEHPCINEVLRAHGLAPAASGDTPAQEARTKPVFLAWSGREELLRSPEYALLSHESVAYARLPLGRGELEAGVRLAAEPAHALPEFLELLTPLGQWRWALGRLCAATGHGGPSELRARADALRRFASKHWPGIYEAALDELARGAEDVERVSRLAARLFASADDGALLRACAPVMRWAEERASYERLASLGDALAYAAQGVLGVGAVNDTLASGIDPAEMEAQISEVEQGLRSLHGLGCDLARAPELDAAALRACLSRVRPINGDDAVPRADELEEVRAAVGALIAAAERLVRLQRQIVFALSAAP